LQRVQPHYGLGLSERRSVVIVGSRMSTFDDILGGLGGASAESTDQLTVTASVKPAEGGAGERNALLDPELMALFRTLLEVLGPFPDARARVAQALMDDGLNPAA